MAGNEFDHTHWSDGHFDFLFVCLTTPIYYTHKDAARGLLQTQPFGRVRVTSVYTSLVACGARMYTL